MALNNLTEKPLGSNSVEILNLYHLFLDALHRVEDEKREPKLRLKRRTGFVADPFPSDIFKRSLGRLLSEPGEVLKDEEEHASHDFNQDIATIFGGPGMGLRRYGMLLLLIINPTLFPLGDFKSLKADIKYPLLKRIATWLGFNEATIENIAHHVHTNLKDFGAIESVLHFHKGQHFPSPIEASEIIEPTLHGSCPFFTFNKIEEAYLRIADGVEIYDMAFFKNKPPFFLALEANYLLLIGDYIQRNNLMNHYCALSYVAKSFLHLIFSDSSPWIPLVVDRIKQLV